MESKGLKYRDFLLSFNGKFEFFPVHGKDEIHGKRIYLRHDVDFNLVSAVHMAEEEAELGIKSTYYLLNTAKYWRHDLSEPIKIIQSFGHEVGWHNNSLAQFYVYDKGKGLKQIVDDVLKQLRDYGANVWGSASHGDQYCADMKFLNYHIFDIKEMKFERFARRPDHPIFNLTDFGLEYEAYFAYRNLYLSDSGSKFNLDPLSVAETFNKANNFTLQILIHPDWWSL